MAWGATEIFVDAGEAVLDYAVHVIAANGEGKFVLGARQSFGHELGQVGEGACGFEVVVTTSDRDEGAAERGGEGAVADEIGG